METGGSSGDRTQLKGDFPSTMGGRQPSPMYDPEHRLFYSALPRGVFQGFLIFILEMSIGLKLEFCFWEEASFCSWEFSL